ncbi:MAG: hypothetical protein AAGF90_07425, partial [Pseudomonadota bacterium]
HYNLLYYIDLFPDAPEVRLDREPVYQRLLREGERVVAHLLHAPDDEVRARMAARRAIEPDFDGPKTAYPAERSLERLSRVSQADLLCEAEDLLRRAGAEVLSISADGRGFVRRELSKA